MSTNIANLRQDSGTEKPAPKTILQYLNDDPRIEKSIAAVAGQYFTPDRFLKLAVNAVKKTPLLRECDPQSVLGAFMASAALGLEPNTVQQQAFLIPYRKRARVYNNDSGKWEWIDTYDCQFQIGYRGFITLAHRSPHIKSIQAEAIHEHDMFEHMVGTNAFLKFQKTLKNRGELIGAFSYVRLESGTETAVVLTLDDILKIRSKSETFNSLTAKVEQAENDKERDKAQRKLDETPWVFWPDEMSAKSAIKRHAKQLPLNPGDALSAATVIDNQADAGVIDMAAMADPDVARGVVQDGYEPPALEDDPSPTIPAVDIPQREAEPLVVNTGRREPQRAASQAEDGAEQMNPAGVLAAIRTAADHGALERAGMDIQDCPPAAQADLGAAYRKRLDELDSAPSAGRSQSLNLE